MVLSGPSFIRYIDGSFALYSVEQLACGDECWAVRNTGERLYIPDEAGAGLGIEIILAILRKFWAAARWNSSFAAQYRIGIVVDHHVRAR